MSHNLSLLPEAILVAAQALLDRVLALDPEGSARLAEVQGRVLYVELDGLGMGFFIVPDEHRLQLFARYDTEPDCTVRGTPAALLRLALSAQPERLLFAGEVTIVGDDRCARRIGAVLRGLNLDWEEALAQVCGDAAARRLGERMRDGRRWAERSATALAQHLRDYLQKDSQLVPSADELQRFLGAVDLLRDDVERLAARIDRLTARLSTIR